MLVQRKSEDLRSECHQFTFGRLYQKGRMLLLYVRLKYLNAICFRFIGTIFPNAIYFTLHRQLICSLLQTYIPTTIIVAVSWLSFLIPPEAHPGRMGMLVVLVLVIINIMLKIIETSPLRSGICGLTIWTIICLIMVRLI